MSYAVIFTSIRTHHEEDAYQEMALKMEEMAKLQEGFMGMNSARNDVGITVSYWQSLEAIKRWKNQLDHQLAQQLGREKWYQYYKVEICKIEKAYDYGYS